MGKALEILDHIGGKPAEEEVSLPFDTALVIDMDTGEIIPAYVFLAIFPYSGYAYMEAFYSLDREAGPRHTERIQTFWRCYMYSPMRHPQTEVILNKSYNDLVEHYGTAILPCRVRSPKDRARVEGTGSIICNFILAALRNRRFLSLAELNEAIGERLYEFNNKSFQKKDGCRALAFEEEKNVSSAPAAMPL